VNDRLLPIDIRRAILAVFMRAGGGPLTIDDVVQRVREEERLDLDALRGVPGRRRVSDVMRYQTRAGRATAVERGRYCVDLREFSESSRWRCLHWRRVAEQRARRYRGAL